MRRIVVLGNPGSGKSTLARELSRRLDLPVVHLDRLFWAPGWTPRPRAEVRAALEPLLVADRWVTEGNYAWTFDLRLPRADLVVVLNLPRRVTIPRTVLRALRSRGRTRSDMGQDCPERLAPDFVRYQWRYPRDQAPTVEAGLVHHGVPDEHVVRLGSARAVDRWLAAMPAAPP